MMFDASPHQAYFDDPQDGTVEVATAEEEEMHVLVDGVWHRDVISGATRQVFHTACGTVYHSQFAIRRRGEYRGPLCQCGCFTTFELGLVPDEEAL
jgi:hypothetical protein